MFMTLEEKWGYSLLDFMFETNSKRKSDEKRIIKFNFTL
jgi:hypothetical protein